MTITDPKPAADEAARRAGNARRDAHTVTGLVDHTNLVDQALVGALDQADQYRDGLALLVQHIQNPVSMLVPSRANALRRHDGTMDDDKIVAYLLAVLAGEETPRQILNRLNTERTHSVHLQPGRQVAQSLHELADNQGARSHRIAGQAPVQPSLPPVAPEPPAKPALESAEGFVADAAAELAAAAREHGFPGVQRAPRLADDDPASSAVRVRGWAAAGGVRNPEAVEAIVAVTTMGHPQAGLSPQQAVDQARAALGDTVTMAPVPPAAPQHPATGSVADQGPRPFSEASSLVGAVAGSPGAGSEVETND